LGGGYAGLEGGAEQVGPLEFGSQVDGDGVDVFDVGLTVDEGGKLVLVDFEGFVVLQNVRQQFLRLLLQPIQMHFRVAQLQIAEQAPDGLR